MDRKSYARTRTDSDTDRGAGPAVGAPVHNTQYESTPFVMPSDANGGNRNSAAMAYYSHTPSPDAQLARAGGEQGPPRTPGFIPPTKWVEADSARRAQLQREQEQRNRHSLYPPGLPGAASSSTAYTDPYSGRQSWEGNTWAGSSTALSPTTTVGASPFDDRAAASRRDRSSSTINAAAGSQVTEDSSSSAATRPRGSSKAAEARRERAAVDEWGNPRPLGASRETVIQHEDAGTVVELPPAYREYTAIPAPGLGSSSAPAGTSPPVGTPSPNAGQSPFGTPPNSMPSYGR